jgi:hypothetical protein
MSQDEPPPAPGVGDEADAIEREVVRWLAAGTHPTLIKLAVQDVAGRRQPPR